MTTTEMTFITQTAAKSARRECIDAGRSVSLLAFDPTRDVYAFDVIEEGCLTCGAEDHSTAEHSSPIDAVPTDF